MTGYAHDLWPTVLYRKTIRIFFQYVGRACFCYSVQIIFVKRGSSEPGSSWLFNETSFNPSAALKEATKAVQRNTAPKSFILKWLQV